MPLWRCTWLYQCANSAAHCLACASDCIPWTGNSGRYLTVLNSDSTKALSSARGGGFVHAHAAPGQSLTRWQYSGTPAASMGTIRAGGMSANLGSLATRKISWRSACVNAYRIWASIGTNTAASSVAAPTLQSAHINSCDFTCSSQPGTLTVCLINVPDQFLAVIQGNHSSPSSRIIASSFLIAPAALPSLPRPFPYAAIHAPAPVCVCDLACVCWHCYQMPERLSLALH